MYDYYENFKLVTILVWAPLRWRRWSGSIAAATGVAAAPDNKNLGLKVTCRWGLQFEKRDETTKAGGVRVVCALRFFLCTIGIFLKNLVGERWVCSKTRDSGSAQSFMRRYEIVYDTVTVH